MAWSQPPPARGGGAAAAGPAEPEHGVGLTDATRDRHIRRCDGEQDSRIAVSSMQPMTATVVMELRVAVLGMLYHACQVQRSLA